MHDHAAKPAPREAGVSLLRLSAGRRIAVALIAVVLIWWLRWALSMTAPNFPKIPPEIAPGSSPKITLRNVTLGYDRHPAVHHLDLEIAPGSLLAVCGPNGAGKSTFLKALTGVSSPWGAPSNSAAARSRDIAYLPQAAQVDLSFPIDVFDMAAMGLWRRIGMFGGLTGDRKRCTKRSKRSGSPASSAGPSAPCPAGRPSACCLPA